MYHVTVAARTPAEAAPPTLLELDPILDARALRWISELNAPGSASLACNPRTLTSEIRTRFRNLADYPCELWIDRAGVRVFAGPITAIAPGDEGDLAITAAGLLYYLRYMLIPADEVFEGVDQFTIARQLVAQWQELPYGDFGIDTSAVTTSGVTRSRSYLGTVEEHVVASRLAELAACLDGFDFWIPPTTRILELAAARGADLSATVFLDTRGITSPGSFVSVGAGDVASEAVGRSYDQPTQTMLTAVASNPTLRASFGRCGISATWFQIADPTTLADYTGALLTYRGAPLFTARPALMPVNGADVGDFDVGDTVTWDYDDGLGQRTEARRIARREVAVGDDGTEELSVDFA